MLGPSSNIRQRNQQLARLKDHTIRCPLTAVGEHQVNEGHKVTAEGTASGPEGSVVRARCPVVNRGISGAGEVPGGRQSRGLQPPCDFTGIAVN